MRCWGTGDEKPYTHHGVALPKDPRPACVGEHSTTLGEVHSHARHGRLSRNVNEFDMDSERLPCTRIRYLHDPQRAVRTRYGRHQSDVRHWRSDEEFQARTSARRRSAAGDAKQQVLEEHAVWWNCGILEMQSFDLIAETRDFGLVFRLHQDEFVHSSTSERDAPCKTWNVQTRHMETSTHAHEWRNSAHKTNVKELQISLLPKRRNTHMWGRMSIVRP